MKRIVLASNNLGKLRELQALAGTAFELLPQSDFSVSEVDEVGLSFIENAILKARHAAQHTGLPALADDSGLEVDALNGAPGIHSARYAGPAASDRDNLNKLLQDLSATPEHLRQARFQCVMVYLRHALDPMPVIAQGTWEGRILSAPQGDGGFGYDPVFFVPSEGCTSAELTRERKQQLSHRGKALRQLLTLLTAEKG